jgi:hypothetical protein
MQRSLHARHTLYSAVAILLDEDALASDLHHQILRLGALERHIPGWTVSKVLSGGNLLLREDNVAGVGLREAYDGGARRTAAEERLGLRSRDETLYVTRAEKGKDATVGDGLE